MTTPLTDLITENTDRVNQYAAALLAEARTIAAAQSVDDMRGYLATRNSPVSDGHADDRTVIFAFIGYSRGVMREVAAMAEREAAAAATARATVAMLADVIAEDPGTDPETAVEIASFARPESGR